MRFSVFTASTPDWSPQETVAILAAQGWDGVEWRVTDQVESSTPGFWSGNRSTWPLTGLESTLPEIKRITREAGLQFSAIGGYAQAHDHVDVERLLAATAALGAGRVRVRLPAVPNNDYREAFSRTRSDLEWAVARAEVHDVQVLVELHHDTIVSSASAALRLIDGLDPARIGVIHDIGNMIHEGHEEFGAAFQMLGAYLAHVHVKNAAWRQRADADSDHASAWTAEWVPLREGQGDIDALFRALVAVGYDRWITLEDFSTTSPLLERTGDNLAYVRAAWHHAITGADAGAEGTPSEIAPATENTSERGMQ